MGRTFVFDIPSNTHLPVEAKKILLDNIAGKEIDIFFSHSHKDHFNPSIIQEINSICPSYNVFISYDIYNNHSSIFSENSYLLEPEEEYEINNLKIKTFESNDEGNAYLIELEKNIKIYFGGDLAEWIWPEMKEAEIKFTINYFKEILYELKKQDIFIGFSNMDPRLKNFGGGIRFLTQVKPRYFIPMHNFGKYNHFKKLNDYKKETNSKIFIYSKIGDTFNIEV